MRILVQRVRSASVSVDGTVVGSIGRGMLAFVGFRVGDEEKSIEYLAEKLVHLRIFQDENDKMNLSLEDLGLEVLVVSQFTLYAETEKGNRPSFIAAERPERAQKLYQKLLEKMRQLLGSDRLKEGRFGAMMVVELINDGPVTLILER